MTCRHGEGEPELSEHVSLSSRLLKVSMCCGDAGGGTGAGHGGSGGAVVQVVGGGGCRERTNWKLARSVESPVRFELTTAWFEARYAVHCATGTWVR